MSKIYIKPKDVITVKKASSLFIEAVKLVLSEKAIFNIYIRDESGGIIEVKQVIIEGDCYRLWGSDDTYIKNYILKSFELEEDKSVKIQNEYMSDMYCQETLVREDRPPSWT